LSSLLAQRFAQKSFSPLELYCFNSVFRSLADTESNVKYWSEATLCRFLELPDALGVGSVIFQMASYLGAFPLPSQAPAILTHEALLKVVTIMTRRFEVVLKKRSRDVWLRELYRSLAVYDKGVRSEIDEKGKAEARERHEQRETTSSSLGFAIDKPEGDDGEDELADDELVLAALDAMDATDVFKAGEQSNVHHSIIPTDNLLKLVELLLLIAPVDPQQSVSNLAPELSSHRVEELRQAANVILSSFGVEHHPGVTYRTFNTVVSLCLPLLFNSLHPLFEHFLFVKDFDLSKPKNGPASPTKESKPIIPPPKTELEPILREPGEILNLTTLSQLSFFIEGSQLFRRLRPLYNGNKHGFSMGSFEKQVFNWRAPTILLVKGRLLPPTPSSTRERALENMLPAKRVPNSVPGDAANQTLVYGAYIPTQWKHTGKSCFGDAETKLFQLSPTHDVFSASRYSTDYIYFAKQPIQPAGLGLGTPVAAQSSAHSHSSSQPVFRPGPISLHLDDALEFGIFTHLSEGGGSFDASKLPCRRNKNWQDRFEIEEMEVWGCGGDEVAEAQRKEWAWNEREAEARRRINLGTGDIEADRQLLQMAGIISGDRSGGSI
jgi:hypothetical protein